MKKIFLILLGFGFGVFVLLMSLFHESELVVGEQDNLPVKIEYSTQSADLSGHLLPYPGILPDNPLYFLKMMRDRSRLWVTTSDDEKIDLLIAYGDKRVGAAYVLAKGNKMSLAYETLIKAENYITLAYDFLKAKKDSVSKERWLEFFRVMESHGELVEEMTDMVEGETRVRFKGVLEKYCVMMEQVESCLDGM